MRNGDSTRPPGRPYDLKGDQGHEHATDRWMIPRTSHTKGLVGSLFFIRGNPPANAYVVGDLTSCLSVAELSYPPWMSDA
jgi:hypothetical protein